MTVAGTAGAGDAFSATFSARIAESAPAEDAIIAAAINAASVIGYLDTQSGLLRQQDLNKRIATLGPSLKVMRWAIPVIGYFRTKKTRAVSSCGRTKSDPPPSCIPPETTKFNLPAPATRPEF